MAVGDKAGLNEQGLNEIEQRMKSSGEDIAALMTNQDVSDEAKLVASAILHSGAWVAMAIDANGKGRER